MLLMAIIKAYDDYKTICVSTNLDLRRGFEVFDLFTGFSLPFSVERGIERTPGEKDWVQKQSQN